MLPIPKKVYKNYTYCLSGRNTITSKLKVFYLFNSKICKKFLRRI